MKSLKTHGTCFGIKIPSFRDGNYQIDNFDHDWQIVGPQRMSSLYELATLLTCGEESAILVFSRHANEEQDIKTTIALQKIVDDEIKHEFLLCSLKKEIERRFNSVNMFCNISKWSTRKFFISLDCKDRITHLARVAALDSCVTKILTALLQCKPLKNTLPTRELLYRIREDESRHVRVTRNIVLNASGGEMVLAKEKRLVSISFLKLIQKQKSALESLEISWDRIEKTITKGGF